MRSIAAVVVALAVAGCGVYSVHLDPAPRNADRPGSPLDLTVALGDVQSFANGRAEAVDPDTLAAIDVDFMHALGAARIFRQVLPRGSRADVSVDTVRELHAAPMTGGRTAYLLAVAPLAMLVPGFPHPWDYRVEREVRVWGRVSGTSIPLRRERVVYDERIWGASYWGGFAADPLRPGEGEYIYATLARATAAEPALFQSFAAAARAGDLESAWLVGERARAAASAF
jgi:hypothetical protein